MDWYATNLVSGEKTGINAKNETKGQVPKLKSGFAVNHMSSHGDDFKVTALQLATLTSAMVNGGKLITPFVPRTRQDEARSMPQVRRLVNISAESFNQMAPGMIGSVSYGSGRRAANSQEIIAGKTGTAQVVQLPDHNASPGRQQYLPEQYRHHAWFVAYAPFEAPRIAVVVMIEHAGKGGSQFAGYAKTLIEAYLRQSYPVAAMPLKTTNLTR